MTVEIERRQETKFDRLVKLGIFIALGSFGLLLITASIAVIKGTMLGSGYMP